MLHADCRRFLPTLFESLSCSVDISNITIVGHSAGAHLALYIGTRLAEHALPFTPRLLVPLAPIGDLVRAHELGLSTGGSATRLLMGCEPDSDAKRELYNQASPIARLPIEVRCAVLPQRERCISNEHSIFRVSTPQVPCLLAVGVDDEDVPAPYVKEFYDVAAARQTAQAPVHLLMLSGTDHYTLVDPSHSALRIIHSVMRAM